MIQETLSEILLLKGREVSTDGLVTISHVRMTPDLLVARIYLSIFKAQDADAVMESFKTHGKMLRKALGDKVRYQLRRVPELEFFRDETLDEVFRLEEIFSELKKEEEEKSAKKDSSENE